MSGSSINQNFGAASVASNDICWHPCYGCKGIISNKMVICEY
jgi:hypothetical protein